MEPSITEADCVAYIEAHPGCSAKILAHVFRHKFGGLPKGKARTSHLNKRLLYPAQRRAKLRFEATGQTTLWFPMQSARVPAPKSIVPTPEFYAGGRDHDVLPRAISQVKHTILCVDCDNSSGDILKLKEPILTAIHVSTLTVFGFASMAFSAPRELLSLLQLERATVSTKDAADYLLFYTCLEMATIYAHARFLVYSKDPSLASAVHLLKAKKQLDAKYLASMESLDIELRKLIGPQSS